MSKLINEASIPVLLQEMSIDEKAELLVGKSSFSTKAFDKYGIPSILYLDGATGVNIMQYAMEVAGAVLDTPSGDREEKTSSDQSDGTGEPEMPIVRLIRHMISGDEIPAEFPEHEKKIILDYRKRFAAIRPNGEEPNCFPPGMLLGATFEPQDVYEVGKAVAREAMAYNIDVLLGTPNTNIHRDPKNGRVFESFSEDPCLSAAMAPMFSKAVQDQGMIADVKHFAANNQETLRQGIDEQISERALREIYLPGFEAAVKESGVQTVMSAYNSINGKPCAQNSWLLTEVLKNEWGFTGQVVSDWGAVYDQVKAMNAGNDMDMPGPRSSKKLAEAVRDGRIPMERLDDAVERTLRMILKTPKMQGKRFASIDQELSEKAAYKAAADGITLLKNEGLLPLQKDVRIAAFGKYSRRFMESGSGSAQVDTKKHTSLLTELSRYTDHVLYEDVRDDTDVVLITVGASGQEGSDRPDMRFDPEEEKMLGETLRLAKEAGKKTLVLMNVAGPCDLQDFMEDIDALLLLYFPGGMGARAAADILFGTVSPSGKLPLTWPKKYRDTPTAFNFPGEYGRVNYGEGIFVGYRYYDYKGVEPLFPFGFGLSYSSFEFSSLQLSADEYRNDEKEPLRVTLRVKNTGEMEAKEVVQLYVHAKKPYLLKPEKELKAFRKFLLQPGEEKSVVLQLQPKDFASYDTALHRWTVEPGDYEILAGNSSRSILCKASVRITGKNPYGPSLRSPIGEIAKNEQALGILQEVFGASFSALKLKSNAAYFSAASLKNFLESFVHAASEPEDNWLEKLSETEKRMEEL